MAAGAHIILTVDLESDECDRVPVHYNANLILTADSKSSGLDWRIPFRRATIVKELWIWVNNPRSTGIAHCVLEFLYQTPCISMFLCVRSKQRVNQGIYLINEFLSVKIIIELV